MLVAFRDNDVLQQATFGNMIPVYLEELWELREIREDEWQELLACIQAALCKAIFESFSESQCVALNDLVSSYLAKGILKKDDILAALQLMRENGFDSWYGFSENGVED